MKNFTFISVCLIATLFSCSKVESDSISDSQNSSLVKIGAYLTSPYVPSENEETKSYIADISTGKVFWEESDQISFFYNPMNSSTAKVGGDLFSIYTIDEDKTSASFIGNLNNFIFGNLPDDQKPYLWGVFPYSSTSTCDNETVSVDYPTIQRIRSNSYAVNSHILVAKTVDFQHVNFLPTVAYVRFMLDSSVNPNIPDDIEMIRFTASNSDAKLAGRSKVSVNDGAVSHNVISGYNSVTLQPADTQYFEKDTWYYIQFLPGTIPGFTMRFYTASGDDAKLTMNRQMVLNIDKMINITNPVSNCF